MSTSGYAHICAGVWIDKILMVSEAREERDKFDPHTGEKIGTFLTTQYTYTICGKPIPIIHKQYPKDGLNFNIVFGYDMEKNLTDWLSKNDFLDRDGHSSLKYQHSADTSWGVSHPVGVLGAVSAHYASSHHSTFIELRQTDLTVLLRKAESRLKKIGCEIEPTLHMFADCG